MVHIKESCKGFRDKGVDEGAPLLLEREHKVTAPRKKKICEPLNP